MSQYYQVVVEELSAWLESLAAALPNAVAALVVITLFALVARPVANFVRTAVGSISHSDAITRLAGRMSRYAILLTGAFIALGILGLDKTLTSLLAGAGVIGIALGFAFQDIAANFVAGVLIGLRSPFKLKDVVETNGFMGVVKNINLRATTIETFSGQTVIVPNKEVFTQPLTNYHGTGSRRVEVDLGISYDDDLENAVNVARDAIAKLDFLSTDKEWWPSKKRSMLQRSISRFPSVRSTSVTRQRPCPSLSRSGRRTTGNRSRTVRQDRAS